MATGDRQPPAPRRRRGGRARAAVPARASGCAPAPGAHALEGMVAQWAGALPASTSHDDGAIRSCGDLDPLGAGRRRVRRRRARRPARVPRRVDALPRPPKRVKVQVTGPLTLGVALVDAGVAPSDRVRRSGRASRARGPWRSTTSSPTRCPSAALVLFFDEPALGAVARRRRPARPRGRHRSPVDRARGADCLTGVHVCGDGDLRSRSPPARTSCTSTSSALDSRRRRRARPLPRRRRLGRLGRGPDAPARRRTGRSRCGRHCSTCGAS